FQAIKPPFLLLFPGSRPAVFLLHSFVGGAFLWISNQPSNSLGFILADAGYDVWIGNSRGNTYSSNHKILDLSENKFWEFSFHEMGYYDVPAVIDFILNKTGQKQLFYIGHSEGSTAGFIAFSTWPKLAEKIKVFFALAPITTITFATTPIIKLGAAYEKLFHLGFLNKGTFHLPTYTRKLSAMFCAYLPKFCVHIFCSISGFNIPNLNMSRIDVYAAQWSSGTSGRNFIHWIQMNRAKLFQAYDYGSTEKNMEKYNQTVPPTYKIEDIKIPIAIWTGGQDFFADPRDVAMLVPRISNLIYEKYIPEWQHLDFIWGLDAPEHMYMDIIKIMKKYL
ncbi:lysosomal acid lipase/cholesteryl ester hydrolase-like, partial [Sceloporus undulatus]|uniref:lysosomal acid lipase/cholesteryl ester hydrolase-like n=1 Tax=Sceloporus undulatus TaxID=8520 RepID=UPI001C4D4F53